MKNLKVECKSNVKREHVIERALDAYMLGQITRSEYCNKVNYLMAV